MISEGVSVNVTLLFSLERYREVMEAYISGLESRDGDLSAVSSVASFFISRVDS
jgi:transaldolase